MSAFADNLRDCRKEKGYTQEALCEVLGISRDTLSKWENSSRCPNLNELIKICDVFECDLDYLTGRIEKRTNQLQIACDVTGLSEKSIDILNNIGNDVSIPLPSIESDSLKTELYADYLNILLENYPELLTDIKNSLLSDGTAQYKKELCMKVALNLWNFIDTGEKYPPLRLRNISKFASEFIYERLSFLETAFHSDYNQQKNEE